MKYSFSFKRFRVYVKHKHFTYGIFYAIKLHENILEETLNI